MTRNCSTDCTWMQKWNGCKEVPLRTLLILVSGIKPKENSRPNFPVNSELENTAFEKHQAFIIDASIKWQPGQKYIRRPYRKFVTKTPYPSFSISLRAALPNILGSDLEYQMLSGEVNHELQHWFIRFRTDFSRGWRLHQQG